MHNNTNKKICIFGAGGFGREVLCCLIDLFAEKSLSIYDSIYFMVNDEYYNQSTIMDINVILLSKFDPEKYNVVVAIGDSNLRKKAVESLPKNTTFTTIIHPSAIISKFVNIGEGSIITAGTILTCNINIGKHAHLNLNTTIGHDCIIGDYFTTAPAVNISGNCNIGNCVYFGTNSSVKEKINICNNVTIGLNSGVVKNIDESGVYVGCPIRKIK
jgi:sugar O-acyltransferase (sialic acid O-acetyltransferase NeuD family)